MCESDFASPFFLPLLSSPFLPFSLFFSLFFQIPVLTFPLLPSPLSFLLFTCILLSSTFLPSILLCYSHLSFPVSSHISSPPLLSPFIPSPTLPTSIHLSPNSHSPSFNLLPFTLPSPLVPFYSFPPLLPFSPFLSLFLSSHIFPFALLSSQLLSSHLPFFLSSISLFYTVPTPCLTFFPLYSHLISSPLPFPPPPLHHSPFLSNHFLTLKFPRSDC